MKRFIALMLCVMMLFGTLTFAAFAETTEPQDVPPVMETEAPAAEEESDLFEKAEFYSEKVIKYVQDHIEEISVIITLILTVLYQIRKHKVLNKSIGTLNNNAVAVSEMSNSAIGKALTEVSGVSSVVTDYVGRMENLLAEVRTNEYEKQKLARSLDMAEKYFETAKAANLELANEVAELLVLANIPVSKKEELYARHRAAVDAIAAAGSSEVIGDDSKEA